MKYKFTLLFFAAILCSILSGISSDTVSCKFRTLGIGVPEIKLQYSSKGKASEVSVLADLRSAVSTYSGPNPMTLTQMSSHSKYQADLPENCGLLLLVFTGSGAGSPVLHVLDESLDVFPVGSTRLVNYSDVPFGIRWGDQRLDLQAGESKVIVPPQESVKTQFVQILRDGADGSDAVFSNNWAANPALRTLVIIQHPDGSDAVVVKRFSEASPISKP